MLERGRVDVEDFLDARYGDLQKSAVHIQGGNLTKKRLKLLCKKFHFQYPEVMEKGAWAYIRELFKKDYNGAKNTPIQGLAGHICNMGMRDTNRGFREADLDAWVVLQIHDEICVYVREDQAKQALPIMKKGMEKNKYALLIDIPMIADPLIADNLKDAK